MSLSDLQKKLEKESQGIMFPFSASASTVNTTQNVYDSATDGIMTMQGKKYVGPDSVVQYTPVGQRQLKEIEKGMLPQFDQEQFPDVGQGRVEDRGGTTPLPIDTTPTYESTTPAVDPCPAGYQLINGVCQPIQKSSGGGGNQTPTFDIKDYTPALSRSQGSMKAGAINSMAMMELEKQYGAEAASAIGLMSQKYNNRGAMVKVSKDKEGNVIKNPDGTIKIERIIPNPASNVGEVINDVFTAIGDVAEFVLDNSIVGKIADGLGYTKEQAANVYKLSPEQQKELIDYQEKTKLESSSIPSSFGDITSLDKSLQYFGQLNRDKAVLEMQIKAINEMLPLETRDLPEVQEKFKDQLNKKKRLEEKLKNKENEIAKAQQDAKDKENKLAKSDRQIASNKAREYNRPEEIARKAAQRKAEKDTRAKQGGFKSKEQKTKEFKKMSKDLSSFRKNFM